MRTAQSIIDEAIAIALPATVKSPGADADMTNRLLVMLNQAVDELANQVVDLHNTVASIEQRIVK